MLHDLRYALRLIEQRRCPRPSPSSLSRLASAPTRQSSASFSSPCRCLPARRSPRADQRGWPRAWARPVSAELPRLTAQSDVRQHRRGVLGARRLAAPTSDPVDAPGVAVALTSSAFMRRSTVVRARRRSTGPRPRRRAEPSPAGVDVRRRSSHHRFADSFGRRIRDRRDAGGTELPFLRHADPAAAGQPLSTRAVRDLGWLRRG